MNNIVLIGRLTKNPDVRTSGDTTVAKYTLAVDRIKGEEADFIPCTVFNKGAEFASKYFEKGMRIAVQGRLQTGSYTNAEGSKIYTMEVIVTTQEFADSKKKGDEKQEPSFEDVIES